MIFNKNTVLIVDDVQQNIEIVKDILEEEGFLVEEAFTAEEALEKVKNNDYNLILLDIMLGDSNGFDVCMEIKKLPNKKNEIPIIFLTARIDIESLVNAFEIGAVDYIIKPFNLMELLARVKVHIKLNEKLTKCPVTGLYNEKYFFNYLKSDVEHSIKDNINFSLFLISIDNIYEINNKLGEKKGDDILKDLTYLIKNIKNDTHILFRGPGPSIIYYIPNIENKEQVIKIADDIRRQVYESNIFITNITVSIGIIYFKEFINILTESNYKENIPIKIYNTLKRRVSIAKSKGMNTICDTSSLTEIDKELNKKILLVENDKLNIEIIKNSLEVVSTNIITADNGADAFSIIEEEHPILVISELMVPKLDAFRLRKKMLASSILKDIPFILLSYSKDDEDIIQAFSLNIDYYIQKPYNIVELVEIVKNKIKNIKN